MKQPSLQDLLSVAMGAGRLGGIGLRACAKKAQTYTGRDACATKLLSEKIFFIT